MKEKKKILLSIFGIMLLVLATVGVTFAVFTYTKLGTTENTVTTGTLKFLYTENTGVGNGINIENAFPVSDEVGKGYNTDKYVFDFSVEATNSGIEEIPYEVTLRKKVTSTLSESNIKIYLTDMTDDSDTSIVAPTLYSGLTQTTIDVGEEIEKTIYNGNVLGGELTYKKDFRLRMWIDEKSNQDDINGKTFTALVNVYSNVPLVSEEELNLRDNAEINTITIDDVSAANIEGKDYDYDIVLPKGTKQTSIDIKTINSNSSVEIEKMDSLAYGSSSIKRMSATKKIELSDGENFFKIVVTSENGKVKNDYKIRVRVIEPTDYFDFELYESLRYGSIKDIDIQLKQDYLFNENIEYYSSNTDAITITSDGTLTSVGYGESIISIKIDNIKLSKKIHSGIIEKQDDYFVVSSANDIAEFQEMFNDKKISNTSNLKLVSDIDMSSVVSSSLGSWKGIGTSANQFKGIFDGQNHNIYNFYINDNSTKVIGLINYNSGTIKNINMKTGQVTVNTTHEVYVGTLVGYNYGSVLQCSNAIDSTVTTNSGRIMVGGLVGWNQIDGIIDECYNSGSIIGTNGDTYGYSGGISGMNYGVVKNSYNNGSISGKKVNSSSANSQAGGVLGENGKAGSILNCYNIGTVVASVHAGGITGCHYGTANNTWYLSISPNQFNNYGNGTKTSCGSFSQLNLTASKLGDSFVNDDTKLNNGYPILKWQLN